MSNKTKFISNGARKIILISAVLLVVPVVAFAQGFVPLAPIPGLTNIQYEPNGLAAFFNNLYKFAIGFAAVLAIIMIIWGGLEISTQDSVSKNKDGKERIQNAIFGLVLVLSPVLVFSLINPNILNLSLNLPKIDLTTTPGAGGGTGALPPAPATGCSLAHGGSYIETAVCASSNDAQNYTCKNGLTKQIAACTSVNPITKLCESTSVTVSCSGKTLDIIVYHSVEAGTFFQKVTSADITIPRDAATENAYNSGCSADGGKANKSLVAINVIPCPTDAAIPNFNANTGQAGVACLNARLTCSL